MSLGTVFMIEEFAIYDGPGIRTTVFLKGCPMRCMWCHSPEGQSPSPELIRSPNGCLKCGACIKKAMELTGKPDLIRESMAVCPRNLIREAGECYTPQQLVAKLEKNTKLLAASGGGVTFSGGEPLMQGAFLLECLSLLEGKLHRAIQTSGYADSALFADVLEQCDYMLYDLKLMDPALHRYYCKADNAQILENYRILARSGKEFITRIPLIPTVNDTEENIKQTAAFMKENGVHRVELLPYHNMTGSKYAMTGRVYKPEFDETVKPKLHLDIFQSYRIEVTVL